MLFGSAGGDSHKPILVFGGILSAASLHPPDDVIVIFEFLSAIVCRFLWSVKI